MSKGSPICPIRIPDDLLREMGETIDRANKHRTGEPWTRTDFILTAIKEKIAKMARCRRRRPRGVLPAGPRG